jgi:hypothetical protein
VSSHAGQNSTWFLLNPSPCRATARSTDAPRAYSRQLVLAWADGTYLTTPPKTPATGLPAPPPMNAPRDRGQERGKRFRDPTVPRGLVGRRLEQIDGHTADRYLGDRRAESDGRVAGRA